VPSFKPSVPTRSSKLVITSGQADNNGFSISFDKYNPESWAIDDLKVMVIARLYDLQNNPIIDGKAIMFSTNSGTIEPSCITINGTCSVEWTSSALRSTDGKVNILAYTLGGESFTDSGISDGIYNVEDYWPLTLSPSSIENDVAEAYRDDNSNGHYDEGEEFHDFNSNGLRDEANGIYNGILCPAITEASGECTTEQVNLYRNTGLVMSSSEAKIELYTSDSILVSQPIDLSNGHQTLKVKIADHNGNSMPGGSKVDITIEHGEIAAISANKVPSNSIEPFEMHFTTEKSTNVNGTTGNNYHGH